MESFHLLIQLLLHNSLFNKEYIQQPSPPQPQPIKKLKYGSQVHVQSLLFIRKLKNVWSVSFIINNKNVFSLLSYQLVGIFHGDKLHGELLRILPEGC